MKNLSLFVLLSSLFILGSCNQNNDVPGCTDPMADNYDANATLDDGSCTYPTPYDPTCDGHQTDNSIYPLHDGTTWQYDQNGTNYDYYITVNGTSVVGGVTYYNLEWSQLNGNITGTKQYRIDTNGDIIYNSSGTEYILVKGNPTVGDSWSNKFGQTMQVIDINATTTGVNCTYTGCVEVQNMSTGNIEIYKNGIGLVRDPDFSIRTISW